MSLFNEGEGTTPYSSFSVAPKFDSPDGVAPAFKIHNVKVATANG